MFKTGNPATGKDFIDRKKYLPLFKTYIDQNQSFIIKAPRRFGKTSIVKHLLENKEEYSFLYKAKNSMFNLIKSIQQVKIDDIAEITIKMSQDNDLDEVEYFLHSLDIANEIAVKKKLNLKLAFDDENL